MSFLLFRLRSDRLGVPEHFGWIYFSLQSLKAPHRVSSIMQTVCRVAIHVGIMIIGFRT